VVEPRRHEVDAQRMAGMLGIGGAIAKWLQED
jgi:hypothetical protein